MRCPRPWLAACLCAVVAAAPVPALAQVVFEFRIDGSTPPHADHVPYVARIGIVSPAVVAGGEARLVDVDFLVVRAGANLIRLDDIHPANTDHRVQFSADGRTITGFTQVGDAGDPNTWLIGQSLPTSTSDTDNVVHLGHDRIRHETLFSQPGNTVVSRSDLSGRWVRRGCWCFFPGWPWWWCLLPLLPVVVLPLYLVARRRRS